MAAGSGGGAGDGVWNRPARGLCGLVWGGCRCCSCRMGNHSLCVSLCVAVRRGVAALVARWSSVDGGRSVVVARSVALCGVFDQAGK